MRACTRLSEVAIDLPVLVHIWWVQLTHSGNIHVEHNNFLSIRETCPDKPIGNAIWVVSLCRSLPVGCLIDVNIKRIACTGTSNQLMIVPYEQVWQSVRYDSKERLSYSVPGVYLPLSNTLLLGNHPFGPSTPTSDFLSSPIVCAPMIATVSFVLNPNSSAKKANSWREFVFIPGRSLCGPRTSLHACCAPFSFRQTVFAVSQLTRPTVNILKSTRTLVCKTSAPTAAANAQMSARVILVPELAWRETTVRSACTGTNNPLLSVFVRSTQPDRKSVV